MAAIDKMGRYDLVLVDIGTMYAGGALDLLRNSDRIVFVTDDRQSDRRILRDEIVERLGLAGIGGIHVRNMATERGEADEEMTVSLCRQAFREGDGITTIDLNTTYGADVSVLCEKIMGGNDS
jgi:MinD-like ATPase involved in chromosome partitioning or flagellar assembly